MSILKAICGGSDTGRVETKEGVGEMEHDHRVCPRCGEPAGDGRFCESCRDQIAGTRANDASSPATQALREVLRLEEALAAASKGISDRIAARATGAALQVEPDPRPAADADAAAGAVEVAKLPTSAPERRVEAGRPAREVARLEDVLTVKPQAVEPKAPAPAPEPVSVAPPAPEPVPAAEAKSVSPPAPEPTPAPSFLTAPAVRKGFWFEYMPAGESVEPEAVEPEAAEPEAAEPVAVVDPDPIVAQATSSIADETPGSGPNHWVAALCLIALLGLIALLTGRSTRPAA